MLSVSMDTLFYWGIIKTMNILIVGNGFDLSHYLPTKYDHFMDVMDAIESSNNDEMSFDDLFANCREEWFIAKTKQYYQIENIHLDKEQLIEIKALLRENSWYKYFKNHVQEIETWIDFELKITEALKCIGQFFHNIDAVFNAYGDFNLEIYFLEKTIQKQDYNFYLSTLNCEQLALLKLIIKNNNHGKPKGLVTDKKLAEIDKNWLFSSEKISSGFSKDKYLSFLIKELEVFTNFFNFYLVEIVQKLNPKTALNIQSEEWAQPSKIYSFNYTDTYKKNYKNVKTEYLHGKCGEQQNIVLGISDLHDNSLNELKAFGFTKYHQKLFKDTDYLFLDEYKDNIDAYIERLTAFERDYTGHDKSNMRKMYEIKKTLNLDFFIWGHSLDLSDRDYINDIFSLNDEIDRNVRVIVYYYDDSAKFSLLNNLLAILGKDTVEKWMKKKWLQFKQNPQINFEVEQQQIA